jgi:hypothetical protein
LLPSLGIAVGRNTAVRVLPRSAKPTKLGVPLPGHAAPRVLEIDFALHRGHDYATALIDAGTAPRSTCRPGAARRW